MGIVDVYSFRSMNGSFIDIVNIQGLRYMRIRCVWLMELAVCESLTAATHIITYTKTTLNSIKQMHLIIMLRCKNGSYIGIVDIHGFKSKNGNYIGIVDVHGFRSKNGSYIGIVDVHVLEARMEAVLAL